MFTGDGITEEYLILCNNVEKGKRNIAYQRTVHDAERKITYVEMCVDEKGVQQEIVGEDL